LPILNLFLIIVVFFSAVSRASDGYFKSTANSPFGSNLPSVPSSPPRIPYSSIETQQPFPHNHSHQPTPQQQNPTSTEDPNPLPSPPSLPSTSVETPMMSLEDCEKLALEMKSTVMKMDQNSNSENGGSENGVV
jgi:hypothetical protein